MKKNYKQKICFSTKLTSRLLYYTVVTILFLIIYKYIFVL